MNLMTSSSSLPTSSWAPVVKVAIGLGISVVGVALGRFHHTLRNFLRPTTSATQSAISSAGDNCNADGSSGPLVTGMHQQEHLLHAPTYSISAGFHVINIDECNAADHRSGTGHIDAADKRDPTTCRECIINLENHEDLSETPSIPSPCSWPSSSGEADDEGSLVDDSFGVSCSHEVHPSPTGWKSGVDNAKVDSLDVGTATADTFNTSNFSNTAVSADSANTAAATSVDVADNTDSAAADEDKAGDGDDADDGNNHSANKDDACAAGDVEKFQPEADGHINQSANSADHTATAAIGDDDNNTDTPAASADEDKYGNNIDDGSAHSGGNDDVYAAGDPEAIQLKPVGDLNDSANSARCGQEECAFGAPGVLAEEDPVNVLSVRDGTDADINNREAVINENVVDSEGAKDHSDHFRMAEDFAIIGQKGQSSTVSVECVREQPYVSAMVGLDYAEEGESNINPQATDKPTSNVIVYHQPINGDVDGISNYADSLGASNHVSMADPSVNPGQAQLQSSGLKKVPGDVSELDDYNRCDGEKNSSTVPDADAGTKDAARAVQPAINSVAASSAPSSGAVPSAMTKRSGDFKWDVMWHGVVQLFSPQPSRRTADNNGKKPSLATVAKFADPNADADGKLSENASAANDTTASGSGPSARSNNRCKESRLWMEHSYYLF